MSIWMHMNPNAKSVSEGSCLNALSAAESKTARAFHSTFAEYAPTPLTALPALAADFGLKNVLIKDESYRFGLNAFKVVGGAYAIGKYLAQRLDRPVSEISRELLASPEIKQELGDITFITTTDGNHGRGLAWTARQLGFKCIVYMPKGSEQSRVDHILAEGAQCTVTDLNYDDAVRMTWKIAQEMGYVMVQDTAWDEYEEIPTWIMQGYMTLASEVLEQARAMGVTFTHCFLQAGVGAYAGGVVGHLKAMLGDDAPKCIIVEPHTSNCLYRSAKAGDGKPHAVTGELHTLMAGLACGEPNTVSWKILHDYVDAFISCPDYLAANGMRILAAPLRGDTPIVSGESGAVGTGIVQWLMQHPSAEAQRDQLGLGKDSTVLLISTEGDTAPDVYRNVVWFGGHPDEDM